MQRPDGAWRGDCQGGPHLTAVSLMVEAALGDLGAADREDSLSWLRWQQLDEGGFAWAPGRSHADVTATTCVVEGMLAVGVDPGDETIRRAEGYLRTRGGASGPRPDASGLARSPGALWRTAVPALFAAAGDGLPRRKARAVERYLSERQNPGGSWGGELLTTLAGAMALHSVGVDKTDPRISKAMDHLAHWKRQTPDGLEVLARTSEVRNTADAVRLLCDSGLGDPPDDRLLRALDWLLDQQAEQSPPADWVLGSRRIGGWAVGPQNFMCPDCATTGAVLAAIGAFSEATLAPKRVRPPMRRGAAWLLDMQHDDMQHDDGGWSPFGAGPSDPETTAQAAAGLGRCGYRAGDPPIDRAIRLLRRSRISPAGAEALYSVGLEPPPADRTATPPPPRDVRDRTAERIRQLLDYL